MKTVWLLVAVILVVGLAWTAMIYKPNTKIVNEVKKTTTPLYNGKPGTKISDICINPKDGAPMVWVPEGEFLMGSNDGLDEERPQHKVCLDGYWMYKYEVSVAQYRKFCSKTGRKMVEALKPPNYLAWTWIENHPMMMVTWQDAIDYAKWAGASLPTEAQWEKAARGTDGRRYPWGNKWDALKCNNSSNRLYKTQPVGNYPDDDSPYGCMNMAGNVSEWCADWYEANYYKDTPFKNPTGPANGKERVVRGGSLDYPYPLALRCYSRSYYDPRLRYLSYGFRCAKTP